MVFSGIDAWRSHPIVSGCHKFVLPNVRLGAMIGAGLVVTDLSYRLITGQLGGSGHGHGHGHHEGFRIVNRSNFDSPAEIERD